MARWSDQIELITEPTDQNEYGEIDPDAELETRTVFGDEISVRQSEFYQAYAAGLKPEKVFKVWCIEYAGEKRAKINGVIYHIIRTFTKDGEKMELILSRFPMEG